VSGILNVLLGSSGLKAVVAAFNRVVMLLPGNGSNGGTNNSFSDNGQSYAITRNGNTTQGLFTPFSQPNGYWGGSFVRASSQYLTVPNTGSVFAFGTGAFTIECWVYLKSMPSGTGYPAGYWLFGGGPINNNPGIDFYINNTQIGFNLTNFLSPTVIGNHGISTNTWYHVAVIRGGGSNQTMSIFVNGTRVATATGVTATAVDPTLGVAISAAEPSAATAGNLDGFISNYRVVKGTAVYDPTLSTLTVPTSPLTNITGTSLLTCQNYRFMDNSSNNLTVSTFNTPIIAIQAPFTSGTPQTTGGSMLFDGSGDYLNTTDSNTNYIRGVGNWTVEAFVYPFAYGGSAAGGDIYAMSNGATGGAANGFHVNLGENIDRFRLISNASGTWADNITAGTGGGPRLYEWSHMAMVRDADRISIFKNGTRVNTGTGFSAYRFSTTPNNYSVGVGGGPYLDTNRVANWGLNNYTIEFWTYIYGYGQDFIFNANDGSNRLQVLMLSNGNLVLHQPGDLNFGGSQGNWTLQGWNHVAICRSSQSIAAWVNGVRLSNPQSNTYQPNTATFQIGPRNGGNNRCLIGPVRINNSTSVYAPSSATITVPGATFGGVGGDIILCCQYASATTDGAGATLTVQNGAAVIPFGPNGTSVNNAEPNSIVGRFNDGGTVRDFNGYISNLRFSDSAVYSAAATSITVPTSPYTGGLFSVGATNGNITDAADRSDFETANSMQISTAQSKWGGSAMYFDGTGTGIGSALNLTSAAATYYQTYLNFGTDGFTIEAWVYITSTGVTHTIFYNSTGAQLQINSSNQLTFAISGSAIVTTTGTIPSSTWTHVAVSRDSGSVKLFLNGVQSGSTVSNTTSVTNSGSQYIGTIGNTTALFRGYMNDLRVCNYGLYTNTFALPTAAFPTS
jgi:hypothetical protein